MERRKETRYVTPEIYQRYITFKIKKDSGEFIPIELLVFGLYDIKIRKPFLLPVASTIECSIQIPKSFTKEFLSKPKVKYYIQDESSGWIIEHRKTSKDKNGY